MFCLFPSYAIQNYPKYLTTLSHISEPLKKTGNYSTSDLQIGKTDYNFILRD